MTSRSHGNSTLFRRISEIFGYSVFKRRSFRGTGSNTTSRFSLESVDIVKKVATKLQLHLLRSSCHIRFIVR
jgi:hypothetical protein